MLTYGGNQKESDLLKIKWLSSMILAFGTPVFVFLCNSTPEYHILRFNSDPLTISLLLVSTTLYYYLFVYQGKDAVEVNGDTMK